MLLIATDEAGYGPKLGPLVIVASVWKIDLPKASAADDETLSRVFAPLREPTSIGLSTVRIDDSKAVYHPSSGLEKLHAVVSASHHWCDYPEPTLGPMVHRIAAADVAAIERTPWLGRLGDQPFLPRPETVSAIASWQTGGANLVAVRARIITATEFNQACTDGKNKADLLSQTTLGLVREMVEHFGDDESEVRVFCDRHGGRRYYAGVLQHVFEDWQVRVTSEARRQSVYRITGGSHSADDQTIDVAFTVKGDSFTPVAFSSLHAKYLRERMMDSLNAYFMALHRSDLPLRRTAGYPVDADRFLRDIARVIQREKISPDDLVRKL